MCVLCDHSQIVLDSYLLHCEDSEFCVDLVHSTRLCSLNIQYWWEPQDPQHLSDLLSGVVSCEMEEMIIGLSLDHTDIDLMAWSHVDVILAQPQFSKLRTLRICTDSLRSALFIDRLPRSHSRGILSIESLQWELPML